MTDELWTIATGVLLGLAEAVTGVVVGAIAVVRVLGYCGISLVMLSADTCLLVQLFIFCG